MSQLKVGDRVLTLDVATRTTKFDDVIGFSHRLPAGNRKSMYTCMTLENGASMCSTPEHLICIPTLPDAAAASSLECQYVFTRDIRPGFIVLYNNNSLSTLQRVAAVSSDYSDNGLYSPLTSSGTLVVDGVLASCYATIPSHWLMHWLWSPLRVVYNTYNYFGLKGFQQALSDVLAASGEAVWWGTFALTQTVSIG